jgi:hypothetical protein
MGRLVVDREEPFTAWLFFRKDSQRAADALLDELRAKGRLTKKEMSQFAWKLEAGDLGFRFSKVNFYKKVLRTFLDLGFVKIETVYGGEEEKTLEAYLPVLQLIPTRPPSNPSFWFVTYDVCRWWNGIMFPKDELGVTAGAE